MAIDSSMLQLYGKPIFTIDGTDDDERRTESGFTGANFDTARMNLRFTIYDLRDEMRNCLARVGTKTASLRCCEYPIPDMAKVCLDDECPCLPSRIISLHKAELGNLELSDRGRCLHFHNLGWCDGGVDGNSQTRWNCSDDLLRERKADDAPQDGKKCCGKRAALLSWVELFRQILRESRSQAAGQKQARGNQFLNLAASRVTKSYKTVGCTCHRCTGADAAGRRPWHASTFQRFNEAIAMAIDSSMLQLYGKPIFTIDGRMMMNSAQNQDSLVQILIQPE